MESPQGTKNHNAEVLIVEDSATQAEQLQHLLEEGGYTATVASDGKQALAMARKRRPALIISDIVMPEMDGYTLCKEMKADKELRDVPVLLLTSLSGAEEVLKALQCGADNFVRKPYDGKRLLGVIEYMLTNRELRKSGKMQLGLEIDIGGEKHFITSERQQILDLLLSTFMEAIQLNREVQAREKELARSYQSLQGLYGVADTLNQAKYEQDVLNNALKQVMNLPGVQAGWVALREGETGFRLAAACGLPPALEVPGAFEGDCLCRRKLLAGELDHTTNILECERLREVKGDTCGLRYHASIPLWIGNRVVGVMNLAGPEQGLFHDKDLEILYSVGNQVAVALERTQLLQQMEKKVEERTAALTAEITHREQLTAILEATTDLVGMADLQGNLFYLNNGGRKMLGVGHDEDILGTKVGQYHPEWARKLVLEEGIPTAIRDGVWMGETAFLIRTGREVPVSQVILAHKAPDGAVEFLSTIARDITERKKFEEALRKSEAQLKEAQHIAELGYWEWDVDTDTDSWSEELYRIFGRDPNLPAPTYKEHPSLYTAESWALLKNAVERALATGEPYELELELIRPDGEHRWIIAQGEAGVRDETGRVLRLHGIGQDITERKQLEQQFFQAQKMESIGRLAGGIAHDFNNHLGIIIGYSELLLERLGANDPLRKNAGMIKEAGLRSASLTRQLLAFSRRQVFEPRILDLNEVVSELEKMLRPLIGEDIELATSLDPVLGKVRGDSTQMEQVIMNLAVNARDAMSQGGRLTIETKNVELDEAYAKAHVTAHAGPHVMLAVSDTGMGMAPETLTHIYEPFFTTKEKGKGTGLGLAMVYGIVKQSGGWIWVYSEPGHGTTFKIYLPQVEAGIRGAEAERASPVALKGEETILVVEDEGMLRELACEFLQSSGYTVLEAANGAEAIEISKRHPGPIHLLMTDAVMPGMSGRELAQRLQGHRPDIKVLYVSGYTDDVVLRNGLLEPGMGFLQKPFTRDALTNKVRAVLEGGKGATYDS